MVRTPLKQDENLQLNTRQYTIDKVIGRGATCIVYSAYYKDGSNHRHYVNIKECYPHNVGITRGGQMLCWKSLEEKSQHIAEFHKAYDKVMLCQNGNYTVHAFDIFENNNTAYIIMDANEGATFDKSSVNNVVEVLKTVRLLAYAVGNYHNNGYLHLDIKPSNFLVYPRPSEHIVLFDMDTVTSIQNITSGNVKHIPYSDNWAAPEQKQGKISKLCAATDIYAIGAILFEKIMGRSIEADDMSVFADWEFEGEKFDKLNPKIKRLLHTIFHKTLSANIKRRYQSCDDLIADLDKAIKILVAGKPFLISTCPNALNNFIGRKQDIEEIKSILKHENNIFVYGVAGTGKTELAKKYAELYKSDFDTVVFCKYDSSLISTLRNITIENADYSETKDRDFIKKELPKLCDYNLLIILDNFDVDIDEEEYLEDFLNLNCKKIITTRTDFHGINSSIHELKNLENEECFDLFKCHSKIEDLTIEQKASLIDIFECIAYNTYFISILAKRMYEKNISLNKLYNEVQSNLLKKSGKIVTYKDGKQSNKTIYEIAKALFNMDDFFEEEFNILRNLYMLRWRTITIKDYEKIACYNADADSIENKIDFLNKLERLGWVLNSNDSNRQIHLHPIVLELVFEELCPSVYNCTEIASYYQNELKKVLSVNDNTNDSVRVKETYLEMIFGFYKSLDIKNKNNFEYLINSIYASFTKIFTCSHPMLSLILDSLLSKDCAEPFDLCDDSIKLKLVNIRIWFILNSICADFLLDCFDKWEEPAIADITAIYENCIDNPSEENIRYFVKGVTLFSRYFKTLYESGRLKELLGFSTWSFKEKEFLQIEEYIKTLNHYMTSKQKNICEEYFSHNLKEIIKVVKVLPEIVVRESQESANSSFMGYVKAILYKQKNVLSTIMEDDNLSLNGKVELVKIYYDRCVDSFYDSFHFGTKWNGKEDDQKNKYNFLKEFTLKYGSVFDKSVECFNYIRWMYACLSLNYNVEDFHANMKILMKQLEEISIRRVVSNKDFLSIWTPFEEQRDLFEYEMINPQLISKYILPYIKEYLSFCESLFDRKGINKNDWYASVCIGLKNYAQRYGSGFLTLFKDYEVKYHNCLGIDYTLTKNQ